MEKKTNREKNEKGRLKDKQWDKINKPDELKDRENDRKNRQRVEIKMKERDLKTTT